MLYNPWMDRTCVNVNNKNRHACNIRVWSSSTNSVTITESKADYSFVFLQKKMDFTLKVVGGDISAIPGVADALEV